MKTLPRFIPRYFCNLENPEATKAWFILDRKTGLPVFDDSGIRYFDKEEVQEFIAKK